jgi:hypothetical protein
MVAATSANRLKLRQKTALAPAIAFLLVLASLSQAQPIEHSGILKVT